VGRLVSTIEQIIARIAEVQHGIVTWAEMRAAEISEKEILHRIRIGLLVRVYRGVYSVGHRPLTVEARYVAAVKACGEDAVLCGRAAAYLLGILKASSPPPPDVMTPTERRVKGLKPRRGKPDPSEVWRVKGIPCTSPARTIVDLAPRMDDDAFARVCHEAGVRYKTTPRQVKAVMARRGRTNGAARIRRVVEGEAKVTLSVLEKAFLKALEAAGLPLPDTNIRVGRHRVDCHWIEYGLTVELVSYQFHNSYYAWDKDHDRERDARSRGHEWRRFTYDDVFVDQTYMLGELRKLLTPSAA
jgi:hypothetical protein